MVAVWVSPGFAAPEAAAPAGSVAIVVSLVMRRHPWFAASAPVIAYSRARIGSLKSSAPQVPGKAGRNLRTSHEGDGVEGPESAVRVDAAARSGGRSGRGGGPRHHLRRRPDDPARQGR